MKYTVYSILNRNNGKRYVGVTNNVESRKSDHFSALRRKEHHSYRLQSDWNVGKEDDFVIEILEEYVSSSERYNREQFWMDEYRSYEEEFGYNISPTAGTTLGRRHRPESRVLMSISHSNKELTDEHKKAISESMKGMVKTEEHQQKITEALGNRCLSIYARGERAGMAKLKEEQVLRILQELDKGSTHKELAEKYQVSKSTIGAIGCGRTWKHVFERYKNNKEAVI